MKKLAIIGHPTRGREIIEILEMLGGKNGDEYGYRWECKNPQLAYYIYDDTGRVEYINTCNPNEDILRYTLEEFLEKYPYKIKDRVIVPGYGEKVCIIGMFWNGNEVLYEVLADKVEQYSAKELNEFNEPNKSNKEKKINQISLVNCDLDEVEIVLGDKFELKIEDGKYYAVKKKPQYPKTYKECCEVLGLNTLDNDAQGYRADLIICFQELLIARNAYWEIAGEEMGLGKPWKPDFKDDSDKYFICYLKDEIWKSNIRDCNRFLVFSTEKIRDEFYENFKDSIKTCKNLI